MNLPKCDTTLIEINTTYQEHATQLTNEPKKGRCIWNSEVRLMLVLNNKEIKKNSQLRHVSHIHM